MKPNDAWRQHAIKEDNDYHDPNPYEEVLRAAAYIIGGCLAGGMFALITGWVIGYWSGK